MELLDYPNHFTQGKARTASIRCKFDRVTGTFLFQQLEETQTFTSTVDQLFIDLKSSHGAKFLQILQ